MVIHLLLAAALHVDPDAGNNKFSATFDAPLGERIEAVSSAVACDVSYDDKAGAASGNCSVPLTSIMVDNEPTKTEHFQQWVTNKKSEPKECKIEAKFDGLKVDPPALSATPSKISGEVPFTVCGRPRSDGKKPTEVVKCAGINEGQGHGSCSGADNSCKSKNECKGKGWTETASAKECTDKGGKALTAKM